jgi:YidC/Oxa1 family membrane protein insertase
MFSTLFDPFITAAYHVVSWLAQLVEPLAGATSTAAAIILFTMAVRALLHPLVRAQVRGEKVRATMAPKVKALRDKHGKNTERLNKELAELYSSEGRTMFAGCLPMLIQIPFFSIMYQLFLHTTVGGQPNELLTHTLFGVGLNQTLFSTPNITVHLGLFAVMAAVATWSSIRAAHQMRTADQKTPGAALLRFLPYGTIVFAAFMPLAAGLYLLTTTTWATVERVVLTTPQVPVTT